MIFLIRGLGLLAIALLLNGCVQSACLPGPYLEAEARPPMVIPDGMDAPDRQLALRVPDDRAAPGRPGSDADGCIADPPSFYAEAGDANLEGLPVRASATASAPAAAAPRDAPVAAPASVTSEVTRMIEDWAAAWSRRDFDAWVQFYEPDFAPEGYDDNAAWRSEQRRLFDIQATTRLEPDSMSVTILPEGKVRARFRQQFGLEDQERTVMKELVLTPSPRGAGWLISEDYVVEVE